MMFFSKALGSPIWNAVPSWNSAKLQRFKVYNLCMKQFILRENFTFWKPNRNCNVSTVSMMENGNCMINAKVVTLQLVVILRSTPGHDRILKPCWKPPTVHVDSNWSSSMPVVGTLIAAKGGEGMIPYKVGPWIQLDPVINGVKQPP